MQIVVSIIFNYIILMSDDDDRLDLVPKYINSVLTQRARGAGEEVTWTDTRCTRWTQSDDK